MPQKEIQTIVTPLCQRLADKMNYELVDAELVKEGPGRYLRIYIDRPGFSRSWNGSIMIFWRSVPPGWTGR